MNDPRSVVEAFYEAFNRHDAEAMAGFYSEWGDFVAPGGLTMQGRELASQYDRAWLLAFPDLQIELTAVIASGATVVVEAIGRGTHLGPLRGPRGIVAATGRKIWEPFTVVYQVEEGQIISAHLYYDRAALLAQLGEVPEGLSA